MPIQEISEIVISLLPRTHKKTKTITGHLMSINMFSSPWLMKKTFIEYK